MFEIDENVLRPTPGSGGVGVQEAGLFYNGGLGATESRIVTKVHSVGAWQPVNLQPAR